MKHHGGEDSSDPLDVDICATILTKTPPRLPLREELPSLGFEVIYRAAGVGVKASKHEAHRVAKAFRRHEEIKELKKRRFFRKSSKRIKEQLEQRRQLVYQLQHSPRALSYEAYDRELHNDKGGSSTCGSSSCDVTTDSSAHSYGHSTQKQTYHTRRTKQRWSLLRQKIRSLRNKTHKDDAPNSLNIARRNESRLDDILGEAAFPDYLAPFDNPESHTAASTTPKSTAIHSKDQSSITTDETELRFDVSPSSMPYLPGLNTVEETDEGNERIAEYDNLLKELRITKEPKERSLHPSATKSSKDPSSLSTPLSTGKPGDTIQVVAAAGVDLPGLKSESDLLESPKGGLQQKVHATFDDLAASPTTESNVVEAVKDVFASFDASNNIYEDNGDDLFDDDGILETSEENLSAVKLDDTVVAAFAESKANNVPEDCKDQLWLSSAKHAIGNITADFFKIVGIGSDEEAGQHETIEIGSIDALFKAVAKTGTVADSIRPCLKENPEFAQVRRQRDGRLLLHALCDRGMPNRSSVESTEKLDFLIKDAADFQESLQLIQSLHTNACLSKDSKGDLPVHLLARMFSQWEAQWYATVYKEAGKKDVEKKTGDAITNIYRTMSECIELVLKPVVKDKTLCELPGSVGRILPLHIATIFTSAVSTLRMILEAYPEAASIPCDLADLKTLVPSGLLPLELHNKLSTDFPKWEIEAKEDSNPEIKWSQSKSHHHSFEDCIRRSDLLLAYNPIEPYSHEKARLRRLESRLQYEAKLVIEDDSKTISRASQLVWVWFCTSLEPETNKAAYVKSTRRIVEGLPLSSLRLLASVKVTGGECVLDTAAQECLASIRRRLDRLSESIVPLAATSKLPGSDSQATSDKSSSASSKVFRTWTETQNDRLTTTERGLVSHLCKLIFNLEKLSYPTSFVILPYKLYKTEDGKIGIESAESATPAMKFADHILQLTDPKSILYYLDCKSIKYFRDSLYGEVEDLDRLDAYESIKRHEEALLGLYEMGDAYLYLIDELSGIPSIPQESAEFPIVLVDSLSLIRKVLPLMLIGMIQMRGEKALSVLITVLLDNSISIVPKKWPEAARKVSAYLYSQKSKESRESGTALATTHELMQFISRSEERLRSDSSPKNGSGEWNVELSIFKMLLDMYDPHHSFAGLRPREEAKGVVSWTMQSTSEEVLKSEIQFKPIVSDAAVSSIDVNENDTKMKSQNSFPVDVDEFEDFMEKHKLETRASGPVDLDESAPSDDASSVPDIDALWKKHVELSHLHAAVRTDRRKEAPPRLAFPQPQDEESNKLNRGASLRIVRSVYSDESEEDDIILHSKTLPGSDSRSLVLSPLCGEPSRFSLLFDDLAVTTDNQEVEQREPSSSEICGLDDGERVWHDVMGHLEKCGSVFEDVRVTKMKVDLASAADKLSLLNRRAAALKVREGIALSSGVGTERDEAIEWRKNGFNSAAVSRKLFLRLSGLEDRILVDEIDLQHVSLETFVLRQELEQCLGGEDHFEARNDASTMLRTISESEICDEIVPSPAENKATKDWNQLVVDSRSDDVHSPLAWKSDVDSSPQNIEHSVEAKQSTNDQRDGVAGTSVEALRLSNGTPDQSAARSDGLPSSITFPTVDLEAALGEAVADWIVYDPETGRIEI